jgi:hypothetical protein
LHFVKAAPSAFRTLRSASAFEVDVGRLGNGITRDELPKVLRALGLEQANQRMWRRGGKSWHRRAGHDMVAFKLEEFGKQLGRKAPRKRRRGGSGEAL